MSANVHTQFWDLVDGVMVINLDERTDRWGQFQTAARDIIPPEKLHRLSARLGREIPGFGQRPWFRGGRRDRTWAARAGVTQSHRQALLQANKSGWQTVLVLEDDVSFASNFAALSQEIARALQEQEWQLCYLGFTDAWWPRRKLDELDPKHALYQVHGCNTAHAYLVRQPARDWIINHLPGEKNVWSWLATHRAIDRWLQRQVGLEFPVICISPSVVNQSAGYSDIVERQTDYAAAHERAVPTASSAGATYYLGHAFRRISVRLGLIADAVHGGVRRITGF